MMTCIRDSDKLRKMSLGYINSLMRRSSSAQTRTDIMNQHEEEAESSDEERSTEEKPLKTGFLNDIKQRFQRRLTGVRSRYRSRMRRSSSLNDSSERDISTLSNIEVADEPSPEQPGIPTNTETESAELRTQSLSGHLLQLSKYGWYWGPITREEAEEKLANQPDGSFLVRDSSNDHFLLSVSFRCSGRTFHSRIFHSGGKFSFYASPEPSGFNSIPELVEHSISSSQSTVFCYSRPRSPGHPSFPVRLAKPVSRITHVRSLQYLCRFVIRQYTRVDQIKDLPLPSTICGYIEEGQF